MICPKCGAQTTKTKQGPFNIVTCDKCGLGYGSVSSNNSKNTEGAKK